MKKIIVSLIAILGFAITGMAQEVAKKVIKKTETITKVVKKTDIKVTDAKVVLKKDGTPDKRYKATEKKVLKKDGTPDKRYK
jgi:hypothetical protein